jgi:hypothetical protein
MDQRRLDSVLNMASSARTLALEPLDCWRRHHRFADEIVQELLEQTDLSGEDRGFAVDPFYGALRNLTLLDFRMDRLPPGSLDANSRDILRLGLTKAI